MPHIICNRNPNERVPLLSRTLHPPPSAPYDHRAEGATVQTWTTFVNGAAGARPPLPKRKGLSRSSTSSSTSKSSGSSSSSPSKSQTRHGKRPAKKLQKRRGNPGHSTNDGVQQEQMGGKAIPTITLSPPDSLIAEALVPSYQHERQDSQGWLKVERCVYIPPPRQNRRMVSDVESQYTYTSFPDPDTRPFERIRRFFHSISNSIRDTLSPLDIRLYFIVGLMCLVLGIILCTAMAWELRYADGMYRIMDKAEAGQMLRRDVESPGGQGMLEAFWEAVRLQGGFW